MHQNAALCGNGLRSLFETKKMKEVIRWGPRQVGGVAFRSARCAFCVDVQHEFRNVNGVNAAVSCLASFCIWVDPYPACLILFGFSIGMTL